jgi:hypothetical protein
MTIITKLHILLTALRLGLGSFFAYNWFREHEAFIRADAQAKADQSALAQLAKQQNDLAAQLKQTQVEQQTQLAALHKEYAQAQSPEQLAALISNVMNLPQPIRITTPPPTNDNPHPTPVAEVPLPDAPQAKAFVQACQECQIKLSAAQKAAAVTSQQDRRAQWGGTPRFAPWLARGVRQPREAEKTTHPQPARRISTDVPVGQRFLLTVRPISYIMLTTK